MSHYSNSLQNSHTNATFGENGLNSINWLDIFDGLVLQGFCEFEAALCGEKCTLREKHENNVIGLLRVAVWDFSVAFASNSQQYCNETPILEIYTC